MGRQLIDSFVSDTGPVAVQALGAEAAIGGLQITIGAGLGARVGVDWAITVDNDAAAVAETIAGPALDGVRIAGQSQTVDLPAVAGYRKGMSGHCIVAGTALAQVLTVRAADLVGNTSVQADEASLKATLLTQAAGAEPAISSP